MTSETDSAAKSGQESVVLASFESYRHAEHMLASLGRGFRRKARRGGVTVLMRVSLSWMVGFTGLFAMLK